eukprot:2024471-Prymnesium_polylepis.1
MNGLTTSCAHSSATGRSTHALSCHNTTSPLGYAARSRSETFPLPRKMMHGAGCSCRYLSYSLRASAVVQPEGGGTTGRKQI